MYRQFLDAATVAIQSFGSVLLSFIRKKSMMQASVQDREKLCVKFIRFNCLGD